MSTSGVQDRCGARPRGGVPSPAARRRRPVVFRALSHSLHCVGNRRASDAESRDSERAAVASPRTAGDAGGRHSDGAQRRAHVAGHLRPHGAVQRLASCSRSSHADGVRPCTGLGLQERSEPAPPRRRARVARGRADDRADGERRRLAPVEDVVSSAPSPPASRLQRHAAPGRAADDRGPASHRAAAEASPDGESRGVRTSPRRSAQQLRIRARTLAAILPRRRSVPVAAVTRSLHALAASRSHH